MKNRRMPEQQPELFAALPPENQKHISAPRSDFAITREDNIAFFHPFNGKASVWLARNYPPGDGNSYFGGLLVIPSFFLPDLIAHALRDGLVMAHC